MKSILNLVFDNDRSEDRLATQSMELLQRAKSASIAELRISALEASD